MLTETTKVFLQNIRTFDGLGERELAAIRNYLKTRNFHKGDTLYSEGDRSNSLFVIRRGVVEIFKQKHGKSISLGERGAGQIVGETALIGNSRRYATVVCQEAGECYEFSRDDFIGLMGDHPHVALWILEDLIKRVREADDQKFQQLESQHKNLQQAHQRLRISLIDDTPYPIIVTDSSHNIRLVNNAATEMFGEIKEGMSLWDVVRLANSEFVSIYGDTAVSGRLYHGEVELYNQDNEVVICRVAASPLVDESGGQGGLLIIEDITERRTLEVQVIQREHLAMKGQMAAEIAHEMKNYLTVLQGNSEILPALVRSGNWEKIDQNAENIRHCVDQMNVIASCLLNSHHPAQTKTDVDLNTFLENQIAFLHLQRNFEKLVIKTQWDHSIPELRFDVASLQQIFYNLILNSAEALSQVSSDRCHIWITTRFDKDQEVIHLTVADNGPGFKPGVVERLFSERVSTKPAGHGFGLMTVTRVMNEYGGTVTAANRADGLGAKFCLSFPIDRQGLATTRSQE